MTAPPRDKYVNVRVRPHQAATIAAAAAAQQVTVSEFVRSVVLPEARRVVSRDEDQGHEQ